MLRTQSDARLVDLVRAGHASAFEAIVQRYRKQLLAYCSRLLPASRAEDAVQQTFLKAYQAMISGDAELNLRPWLYRIAHNASLNLLRQNGWSHEQLDENMDGVLRPDQAFELHERLRSTVQAVKALPERQRDAVLLREVEGLSYEEIASALGVGDGAVRQLLHRARTTLRAGMTAVTPVGLVERLAAAMTAGGDPATRVAETAAGIGVGAGAVKLGAAALATGVIATGAVAVPLHRSHHSKPHRAANTVRESAAVPAPAAPTRTVQVDDKSGKGSGSSSSGERPRGSSHHNGSSQHGGSGDKSGSGPGPGGPGEQRSGSEDGSGQNKSGGGNDGSTRHSGSGDRSGDGGGDRNSGGSGDNTTTSQPADTPTEQEHSGDGGGGGGDDPAITAPTTTVPLPGDDSGKGGSNSGSGTSGG
jgi:RNA polymerase sigma factor (sigma-70 family)